MASVALLLSEPSGMGNPRILGWLPDNCNPIQPPKVKWSLSPVWNGPLETIGPRTQTGGGSTPILVPGPFSGARLDGRHSDRHPCVASTCQEPARARPR